MTKDLFSHETVNHILDIPICIEGVGNLHSVKMHVYERFMSKANLITIGYQHFNMEEILKDNEGKDVKLLDLIFLTAVQGNEGEQILQNLVEIFKESLRQSDVRYHVDHNGLKFQLDNGEINRNNYDVVRGVIMKQNLLFEPKVYKNKLVQQFADKVLETRAKSGIDMGIEDYVTTLAVAMGKHPSEIADYTVYQLKALFARLGKFKAYETNLALIGHSTEIGKDHFAEKTDLHKNPYDDVFVQDSKLGKLKDSVS
ncbi:hypothetical protein PQ478_08465 [Alkalihalophilus pseudofirmus]|uniref:hypothetical protein n=1 Tax=Alkalihalophilus pseudofirmus TaxID=79885 RepID=UPI00259BB032|nr:hypothetical protein [Alkalihalophilus pseudofirmus]WEG18501.1 hypothetical protein PQ478_08465 [Alkalihalophilus pseudofirmus]